MLQRILIVVFLLVMIIMQDSDAQVCCRVEHSFPREPFSECAEQLKLDLNANITNDQLMCLHKCYYERIGMFEGTKVVAAQYQRYAKGLDAQLKGAFERAMPLCAAFTVKMMKTSRTLNQLACTPVPYLFNRCLSEVGIALCPKERRIIATFCDDLELRVKQKYGFKR